MANTVLFSHSDSNLAIHGDEKGIHFVATPLNDLLVTLTEEQARELADAIKHYVATK